jgi:prevent-host-death family protein
MGKSYNVAEARSHFSELLDRAAAGEEIVIAKAGKPVVKLVPVKLEPRRPGTAKHWKIPHDLFLEPMSEEELAIAEGSLTDEYGISLPAARKKLRKR